MLSHMVLRLLAEAPASGYGLCKRIEESCGQRPSYGSIYPLLERLAKEGIVTVTKEGRRKVYALTAKGRRSAQEAVEQHGKIIQDEMVRIRRLMELMEMDPGPMLAMLERARRGEPPLGPVTAKMFAFRDLIFRMAQDGRVERHKQEINGMLTDMMKKLEKMV